MMVQLPQGTGKQLSPRANSVTIGDSTERTGCHATIGAHAVVPPNERQDMSRARVGHRLSAPSRAGALVLKLDLVLLHEWLGRSAGQGTLLANCLVRDSKAMVVRGRPERDGRTSLLSGVPRGGWSPETHCREPGPVSAACCLRQSLGWKLRNFLTCPRCGSFDGVDEEAKPRPLHSSASYSPDPATMWKVRGGL